MRKNKKRQAETQTKCSYKKKRVIKQKAVMLLDLRIVYETNMELNTKRKHGKYKALVHRFKKFYEDVVYANISMGACGFIEKYSKKFLNIMTKLN